MRLPHLLLPLLAGAGCTVPSEATPQPTEIQTVGQILEALGVTADAAGSVTPPTEPRRITAVEAAARMPHDSWQVSVQTLEVLAARIRVHCHNLANLQTVGFKRSMLQVAALPDDTGVQALGTMRIHTPGELEQSARNLDIAISGEGFYRVLLENGVMGYTRDGRFHINADSALVTSAGLVVQPGITLAQDVQEVNIDDMGRVTVRTQGSSSVTQIARIQIARFINPSGLVSTDGNILLETDASGPPVVGHAGSRGFGTLRQGFLERSNVEMVSEVLALCRARRLYETLWHEVVGGDPKSPAPIP